MGLSRDLLGDLIASLERALPPEPPLSYGLISLEELQADVAEVLWGRLASGELEDTARPPEDGSSPPTASTDEPGARPSRSSS